MELTREQVIEELQKMLDYCSIRQDSTPERKQALVYAISSLKTDEAYQIMYEGGEIYTKDDVVAMMEELKTEIEELPTNRMSITDSSGLICYGYSEYEPTAKDASKIIQQKINTLGVKEYDN